MNGESVYIVFVTVDVVVVVVAMAIYKPSLNKVRSVINRLNRMR